MLCTGDESIELVDRIASCIDRRIELPHCRHLRRHTNEESTQHRTKAWSCSVRCTGRSTGRKHTEHCSPSAPQCVASSVAETEPPYQNDCTTCMMMDEVGCS